MRTLPCSTLSAMQRGRKWQADAVRQMTRRSNCSCRMQRNGKIHDPYLYTVTARLQRRNETFDEVNARVGVRSFSCDPEKGFIINGKETPLRGVSRHQDMLYKGNALSKEEHYHDAELIKELGANTIRLAHYQHNQYFYDACDELGFVIWAEIPFISVMNKDPEAHQNCISQMKELIIQNYNHPSICFWGISNEIPDRRNFRQLRGEPQRTERACKRVGSDKTDNDRPCKYDADRKPASSYHRCDQLQSLFRMIRRKDGR